MTAAMRVSDRLTTSAACLITSDSVMDRQLERLPVAAGPRAFAERIER